MDPHDPRRLARSTDPATSHEAARDIVLSLADKQQHALSYVRNHPGSTATELARVSDDPDSRAIGRRLKELEEKGIIHRGTPRPCRHTTKKAATWWPGLRPAPGPLLDEF
jgi:predicted transcriptional regulator